MTPVNFSHPQSVKYEVAVTEIVLYIPNKPQILSRYHLQYCEHLELGECGV